MNTAILRKTGIFLMPLILIFLIFFLFNNPKDNILVKAPSKTEIQEWEELKKSRLEGKICQLMKNEIVIYETHGIQCSNKFMNLVTKLKSSINSNDVWFDAVGIPENFRSFEEIQISIDKVYCLKTVEKWNKCSEQSFPK